MTGMTVSNRVMAAAVLAFGGLTVAGPTAANTGLDLDNAPSRATGPYGESIPHAPAATGPLATVADWLERASDTYQKEVVQSLSMADATGISDGVGDATRWATRWIMWWVALAERVYAEGLPLAPAPGRQTVEASSAAPATKDIVVAGAVDKAADRAHAETIEKERQAKAKAELERWKQENDRKIAEGLKKLEEFEKAEKARKAEAAKKAEAEKAAKEAEAARKAEANKRAAVQVEAEQLRAAYRKERAEAEAKRLAEENAAREAQRALDERQAKEEEAKRVAEAARLAAEEAARKAAEQKMIEEAESNAASALATAKEKLAAEEIAALAETAPTPPSAPSAPAVAATAPSVQPPHASRDGATQRLASGTKSEAPRRASKPRHSGAKKKAALRPARKKKSPRYYTVVRGDTLSAIALRFYGRPDAIRHIRRANPGKIRHQDLIYPGMRLRVAGSPR